MRPGVRPVQPTRRAGVPPLRNPRRQVSSHRARPRRRELACRRRTRSSWWRRPPLEPGTNGAPRMPGAVLDALRRDFGTLAARQRVDPKSAKRWWTMRWRSAVSSGGISSSGVAGRAEKRPRNHLPPNSRKNLKRTPPPTDTPMSAARHTRSHYRAASVPPQTQGRHRLGR